MNYVYFRLGVPERGRSQKARRKKGGKNMRRKSKLEENRWPTLRLRTDLATGIVFSANCRVPCGAIKPTFAPAIFVTSRNEGENDGRRGDERILEKTRPGWTAMTKGPKGDTESPYDDCRRLSGPFPRFSSPSSFPYHESYRPFTVRISSNDNVDLPRLTTKNHR